MTIVYFVTKEHGPASKNYPYFSARHGLKECVTSYPFHRREYAVNLELKEKIQNEFDTLTSGVNNLDARIIRGFVTEQTYYNLLCDGVEITIEDVHLALGRDPCIRYINNQIENVLKFSNSAFEQMTTMEYAEYKLRQILEPAVDIPESAPEPNRSIYIIRISGTSTYKIGISHNPAERIKQLMRGALPTENGETLELIFDTGSIWGCEETEREIHAAWALNNLKGEWFSLTNEELKEISKQIHDMATINHHAIGIAPPASYGRMFV